MTSLIRLITLTPSGPPTQFVMAARMAGFNPAMEAAIQSYSFGSRAVLALNGRVEARP
jgi:hypothetical protein